MIISSAARNFSPLLVSHSPPNICFLKFVQIFSTDVSHDSLYISILAEYYARVWEEYFTIFLGIWTDQLNIEYWNRGGRYPIWFNSMFEFCQKMIHSIFDSISLYPRFNSKYYSIQKNSADSIQKIIQFNSQGLFDTGRIGKVPENCPKSVQNRQKRGLFIKNGKYRFKIWFIHSSQDKIQRNIQYHFQEYSIHKIIQ